MRWMPSTGVLEDVRVPGASLPTARRLAVAWQHPDSRAIQPVGVLEFDGARFRFFYVGNVRSVEGFRPLLGFPDLRRTYESRLMFPLFAQRVMDARRPDYERYLTRLRLTEGAAPFEILGRSAGHRKGDTIQLFPEPFVGPDGSTASVFLVNGIRHILNDDPTAEERFNRLRDGDPLVLLDQPENSWNHRAILVSERDRQPLGWVPDLLLDYVHTVKSEGEPSLVVERINGPEVPPHLRLLVRLDGRVPPGYRPFTGSKWEPLR